MREICNEEQVSEVQTENELIIFYCTASWCGPCRRIHPFLETFIERYKDVTFCKCDIDEEEFPFVTEVRAVPTFLFYKKYNYISELLTKGCDPHGLEENIIKLINGDYNKTISDNEVINNIVTLVKKEEPVEVVEEPVEVVEEPVEVVEEPVEKVEEPVEVLPPAPTSFSALGNFIEPVVEEEKVEEVVEKGGMCCTGDVCELNVSCSSTKSDLV